MHQVSILLFYEFGVFYRAMDQGHYNCRDYYISPHFAPTTLVSDGQPKPLERHESFEELEERSRSPASQKAKFPLLDLPLELRQQIFRYLLPHTQEFKDSGLLSEHARNFSAVKKRGARGMIIPTGGSSNITSSFSNVVWQRGNINLLSVCKQLHEECAEMLYSTNTFLLFVTYGGISFRFRWLLPSGLAPSRSYNFLGLLSERYLHLIRRVVVHVDHVDSYTGMIKFDVDGDGLTHGLQNQVRRLVNALQASNESDATAAQRRLAKVYIRVSNGNAVLDSLKSSIVREREGSIKVSEDIEEMLEPFGDWRGVQRVHIIGAVTDSYARRLEARMMDERGLHGDQSEQESEQKLYTNEELPRAFASGDDNRKTNLANLIRGF